MWVLKLKLDSDKQFLGSLAIKHKVSMMGYPLSYWKDDKWIYLLQCGFMFGNDKNKKKLISDYSKNSRCVKVEIKKDFLVTINKQPLYSEPVYDARIIRIDPVIINHKEKKHVWHLASFDKKLLMKVHQFAKKHLNAKIINFSQKKLETISVFRFLPDLTVKQKKALEIAITNGYYDYPKKVDLRKLAELMGVSYSTYQQHLKVAEGKILPAVYKQVDNYRL